MTFKRKLRAMYAIADESRLGDQIPGDRIYWDKAWCSKACVERLTVDGAYDNCPDWTVIKVIVSGPVFSPRDVTPVLDDTAERIWLDIREDGPRKP